MSSRLGICPSAHTASSIPLSKVVVVVRVSESPPKAQRPGPRAEALARWEDLASARVTDSAMSSPRVARPPSPTAPALPWRLVPSLPPAPRPALCFCLPQAASVTCRARQLRSPTAPRSRGVAALGGEPGWSTHPTPQRGPWAAYLQGWHKQPPLCPRPLPASARPESGLWQRRGSLSAPTRVRGGLPSGTIHPSLKSTAAPRGFPPTRSGAQILAGAVDGGGRSQAMGFGALAPRSPRRPARQRRADPAGAVGTGPGPSRARLIAYPAACACAAARPPAHPEPRGGQTTERFAAAQTRGAAGGGFFRS